LIQHIQGQLQTARRDSDHSRGGRADNHAPETASSLGVKPPNVAFAIAS
jgi:hypothetical protein